MNKYVPILKAKAGEFDALKKMTDEVKGRVAPLMDLTSMPKAAEAKGLQAHLEKAVDGIEEAWGTSEIIFVDAFDIDLSARLANGSHPVGFVFEELHKRGVQAVPTVGLDRDAAYEKAVAQAAVSIKTVVVRLLVDDLQDARNLADKLKNLIARVGLGVPHVHLLLDLRSLRNADVAHHLEVVRRAIIKLPDADKYASLIVAGSTTPQSLSEEVKADSIGRIPRQELELWKRLRAEPGAANRVLFGDYGVVHPDNIELNLQTITLAASIRYTANDAIIIARGRSFKAHPQGYKQYHGLSAKIVRLPEFRGSGFSWGDTRLADCAMKKCGPGNKTSWVSIATSHHLALVDAQLRGAA
jgi:hypothetical protein